VTAPTARLTVVTSENSRCSLNVGDYVEIDGAQLRLPPGGRFCTHALMAALPVLGEFQQDLPDDHWLVRKPYVCCPDAGENVVLQLSRAEGSPV
jgi:uncharacterized repeat protein (TIGR04076 family)